MIAMARIVLPLALLLSACAGREGIPPVDEPSPIAHPAEGLVLRVETGGGFVPVELAFREIPGFSLYGDGRVLVTGPVPEIYPGPALPNLQEYRITEAAIQRVLRMAERAGLLGPDRSFDLPTIADAPTTVFTAVAGGTRHRISVYAPGFEEDIEAGVPEEDVEARRRLVGFASRLGDLESTLQEGTWTGPEPYRPEAMLLLVLPPGEQPDPEMEPGIEAWPLDTPLRTFGDPATTIPEGSCGVVDGEDLETVLPLAERATEITLWESEGERYLVAFRPLLPDESGC